MFRLLASVVLVAGAVAPSVTPFRAVPATSTDPTAGLAELVARRQAEWDAIQVRRWQTAERASRSGARSTDARVASSTAYCLTGAAANGKPIQRGEAAMNGVPLGSRWRVAESGATYTVTDRIGSGSDFDIAMPGDCPGARAYGRRTLHLQRVG